MDKLPLSAIKAASKKPTKGSNMRYQTNQRPSCRLLTKRKTIYSLMGEAWHEWRDGGELVPGPDGLTTVRYKDRVCVQYHKNINSLFVPSDQAFGDYIGWTWKDMVWAYYIEDNEWLFVYREIEGEIEGMRELYPDLKRLPIASDEVKILMELTYG